MLGLVETFTTYWWGVVLLCSQGMATGRDTINLAFLAPEFSKHGINVSTSVLAVINAVEDIKEENLLPDLDINVTWYDSGCSEKLAMGRAVETIVNKSVDVLIGPPCSKAADGVGHLASYFNIPLFTWYGTASELSDKNSFTTLVRTFAPAAELGRQVREALREFNWRICALIYTKDKSELADVIFSELQQGPDSVEVTFQTELAPVESGARIVSVFKEIQFEARIVIMALPIKEIRKYMLVAHDLDMVSGDYVFLSVQYDVIKGSLSAENTWQGKDGRNADARKAFRSLLHLSAVNHLSSLYEGSDRIMDNFVNTGLRRACKPPWNNTLPKPAPMLDQYAPYLYDAIYLYALAANYTLAEGGSFRDGARLQTKSTLTKFTGRFSEVVMGQNADRLPDIWYLGMNETGGTQAIAYIDPVLRNGNITSEIKVVGDWNWPSGKPPKDIPDCDFDDSGCQVISAQIVVAIGVPVCIALLLIVVVVIVLSYRRRTLEKLIGSSTWDVQYEDIDFNFRRGCRPQSLIGIGDPTVVAGPTEKTKCHRLGLYRGSVVEVCQYIGKHITPKEALRVELSQMRHLTHANLNAFLGACLSGPVCILWQQSPKGSLKTIIDNKTVKLDEQFKLSLLTDIMRGMEYLHASAICSHGSLTSSNIVVDARWCAKVTRYGLHELNAALKLDRKCSKSKTCKNLPEGWCWTAPELLREVRNIRWGTKKGDMYSFGIIFKETIYRTGPYDEYKAMSGPEIMNRVLHPTNGIIFRPRMVKREGKLEGEDAGSMNKYIGIIERCWAEDANCRPTFKSLQREVQTLRGDPQTSLMDNMLMMLEKYANNLEDIVADRTQELAEEKLKTDKLLYRMLPKSVADSLKKYGEVMAESFDWVTIYFSDIVGFTDIAAASTPLQIVALLNALYSLFDKIITAHDVYKVETIGDAYMIVSGLPNRNGERHASEVGNCALDLRTAVGNFTIPHRPKVGLAIRIGLHTGPCVAGVVGLAMPRYCLFGDTVNTASRMESNGEAMKIHLSSATYNALKKLGQHEMTLRGDIPIKGKGTMRTYWLQGRLEQQSDVIKAPSQVNPHQEEIRYDMNDNLEAY